MSRKEIERSFLDGQLLIAMPNMEDDRFARSVVYICAHSEDGAMGIVINQLSDELDFGELLVQLDIVSEGDEIRLPISVRDMHVHRGGPVEPGRGFVLHSADYYIDSSTLPINDGVCLTATLEVLKAIAEGRGPERSLLALGYAGWAPGQLEAEIQANGWLYCDADPDLIFDEALDSKYERALKRIGIDLGKLSVISGNA